MRAAAWGSALVVVVGLAAGCADRFRRPLTAESIRLSPDRIARGGYIMTELAGCGGCHGPRDEDGSPLARSRPDRFLAGGERVVDSATMGFDADSDGIIQVPNLTADIDTGLGAWTDDEIVRAVRDGVSRDGRLLVPVMPYRSYRFMSDEDVRSVVAYLRTVPAARGDPGAAGSETLSFWTRLGLDWNLRGGHHAPVHDVVAPIPPSRGGDRIAYGRYVSRLGRCGECHGDPGESDGPDGPDGPLSGGRSVDRPAVGRVSAANLTPDPTTGLGRASSAQIENALRSGRRLDGRPMAPPMSLVVGFVSRITKEDLDALVAFLRAARPVRNQVAARELSLEAKRRLGTER
jgi:mono/diheme cytochrome c family protein